VTPAVDSLPAQGGWLVRAAGVLLGAILILAPFDQRFDTHLFSLLLAAPVVCAAWAALHWRSSEGWPKRVLPGAWLLLTLIGGAWLLAKGWPAKYGEKAVLAVVQAGAAAFALGVASGLAGLSAAVRRGLLVAAPLFGWQYLSCFTSTSPGHSFLNIAESGAGMHAMAVALLVIVLHGGVAPLRAWLFPTAVAGALLIVSLGGAFIAAGTGEAMRGRFAGLEWIRDVSPKGAFAFRLQFPFTHHNRLGNFAMTAALGSLVAACLTDRRGLRAACVAVACCAVAALALTQTRGSYIALAAGVAAMAAARVGRPGAWKPLVALAAAALMALAVAPVRERVFSLADPATYRDGLSTVVLRTHSWRAAAEMGAAHPLLGVGYGWKPFELEYRRTYQERLGDPESKPHAHSNPLQVLAESGFPALAAHAAACLWPGVILWRRRRQRAGPALVALWAGLMAYGMANFSLRYLGGVMFWGLLVLALATDEDHSSHAA